MFRGEIALPIAGNYLSQSKLNKRGRARVHADSERQGLRVKRGRAVEHNIPRHNFCQRKPTDGLRFRQSNRRRGQRLSHRAFRKQHDERITVHDRRRSSGDCFSRSKFCNSRRACVYANSERQRLHVRRNCAVEHNGVNNRICKCHSTHRFRLRHSDCHCRHRHSHRAFRWRHD
jgi:hypothetical protein